MTNAKIYNKKTGEQVTDPMTTATIILDATANIVKDFDFITFGSWLGTVIDQWAANNNMTSEDTMSFFDTLKGIAVEVHDTFGMMEKSI